MYTRDKRSPVPKSEAVSRVMSANKAKDTKPELLLRKALWAAGHRGYRLHYKRVPGRPDISFVSKKAPLLTNPGPPPEHLRAGWTSEGWTPLRRTGWFSP